MDRTRTREGFSLVELLVVVAIIGILIGLVMTAVSTGMEKTKRAEALVVAKALVTAMETYNDEYPQLGWPNMLGMLTTESRGVGLVTDNLYKVLAADDMGPLAQLNPHETAFISAGGRKALIGADPGSPNRGLLDPWGRVYRFSIDLEDDGYVTVKDGDGTSDVPGARAVAWSFGKDRSDSSPEEARDNVRTWRRVIGTN